MFKYLKLALKRNKPTCFNQFSLYVKSIRVRTKKINAYRNLFKLSSNSPLPHSFAFIAGFPTLLTALSAKEFGFSPLGLIHLSSDFISLDKIDYQDKFDIELKVNQQIQHPLGTEIQIESRFFQHGVCCLINKNTLLKKSRRPKGHDQQKRKLSTYSQPTTYKTSQREIFNYAKLSGDFNPIHLHKKLATLFGMPKSIVHGLFLAHLVSVRITEPVNQIRFEFKRPCSIGTEIGFMEQDAVWQVFSKDDTLHLNVMTEK